MSKSITFNLKPLVAGGLMALAAGGAQAAIAPTIGQSGVSGEIFLSVWDQAAAKSYSIDLGKTVNEVLSGSVDNFTWQLNQDATWNLFNNTGDSLTFNIAGTNGNIPIGTSGNLNPAYGVLTTKWKPDSLPANNLSVSSFRTAFVADVNNRVTALNTWGNIYNSIPAASQLDTTLNLSEISLSTDTTAYFDNGFWGTRSKGGPFVTSGVVTGATGDILDVFFMHVPAGGTSASPTVFQDLQKEFVFNATAGTLTLVSATAVPVPPALWLLGSALAGMGIIGRRRDA